MKRKIRNKLKRLFVRATRYFNGPFTTAILVEGRQGRFLVEQGDMMVGRRLRIKGDYAEEEIRLLSGLITPDSKIIVAGTHVGVLAVPLCKMADHAYLFEANPRVFRLLQDNLRLNDVSNATAFNYAVGEKDGDITFRLGVLNTGGSKREPMNGSGATLYGGSLAELIQVPMRRMDDLLADVDGEIDLIVMDIEGSEHFALMGMPETLARTKALVVEFIWHHLDNVAGATVDEFLSTISPHFEHLYVPSKGVSCTRDAFSATLRDMHARKQHDDGLIFSRVPFRPWVRRGSPLRRDVARNGLAIGGV